MSQCSQVPLTATICTLATPLWFVCLVRDSRDHVSAEENTRGAQLPFSINPLPHTIKAVRVKHSEGTSVSHCGALQLWNGGALACQDQENQATGALVTLDVMSRKWSAIWGKMPQCTIILLKKKDVAYLILLMIIRCMILHLVCHVLVMVESDQLW